MLLPFLARLVCWVISLYFFINPHHGPGRGTGVPTLQTKRRRRGAGRCCGWPGVMQPAEGCAWAWVHLSGFSHHPRISAKCVCGVKCAVRSVCAFHVCKWSSVSRLIDLPPASQGSPLESLPLAKRSSGLLLCSPGATHMPPGSCYHIQLARSWRPQ